MGVDTNNWKLALSNVLLKFATVKQKPVMHKYLERGHIQIGCDWVHGMIERRLQDWNIYVPVEDAGSSLQFQFCVRNVDKRSLGT